MERDFGWAFSVALWVLYGVGMSRDEKVGLGVSRCTYRFWVLCDCVHSLTIVLMQRPCEALVRCEPRTSTLSYLKPHPLNYHLNMHSHLTPHRESAPPHPPPPPSPSAPPAHHHPPPPPPSSEPAQTDHTPPSPPHPRPANDTPSQ